MSRYGQSRRSFMETMAFAGAAAVTAAGAPRVADAQEKVCRIRAKSDILSLDPAVSHINDFNVRLAILNSLIVYKPGNEWTWMHDAAEYIEQVDPTHLAFRLKPGIMWTNGYGEMTAEDVQYSYLRIANPELNATNRQEFENFESIEVKDKYSGVIVTKVPDPDLWMNALARFSGSIVCKKAWEERGAWTKSLGNDIPCSSGPYKLKEWRLRDRVILDRNELWPGEKPYFDRIEYIVIEDANASELAFLAGELDITEASVGSAVEFMKEPPPNTDVYVRPTTGFVWAGINIQHEPFDDVRVRQAIRKAIDVNQVIEASYFGLTEPSVGIIAPGVLGYRKRDLQPRDVAGAKQLLEEAGLGSGFRTTLTTLTNTTDLTTSQVIQANLAEVGIDVEIMPYEGGVYWNLGLESEGDDWKDLQLVLQSWTSSPDPRRATMWFVCDQVGEWNWQRWCNEEYSDLEYRASLETDVDKRGEMYARMMDLMWDSAAFINLTHTTRVTLVRDTIEPNMMPDGLIHFRALEGKG